MASASAHWFLISPFSCESPYKLYSSLGLRGINGTDEIVYVQVILLSAICRISPDMPSPPFQDTHGRAICAWDIVGGLTGWQIKIKKSMYCTHVEGSTSSSVCLYIQIRRVTINQCIPFWWSCWRCLRAAGIKQRFNHSFISKHCKWSIRQWNVQDSFWLSGVQLLKLLWTALDLPRALQSIPSPIIPS